MYGLNNGQVQTRRLNDMRLVSSSFDIHLGQVKGICELSDGTYVSAAFNFSKQYYNTIDWRCGG